MKRYSSTSFSSFCHWIDDLGSYWSLSLIVWRFSFINACYLQKLFFFIFFFFCIMVPLYYPGPRFKCTSKRGSAFQQEGWGSKIAQVKGEVLLSRRDGAAEIFLLATTRGSRNLVVSGYGQDISDDLGLEHSVVVLRTVCCGPLLTPLSSRRERPNSEIRTIVLS